MNFDDTDWVRQLLTFALVAVVGYVGYRVWYRSDFTIRVRNGRVWYRGKIPEALQPSIHQFLLTDLAPQGPIAILGRWERGRLVLWFQGDLSAGQRQRVRNFLLSRL